MTWELLCDITQWDVRNWSRALPYWQGKIQLSRPQSALAIGEHDGGLSLWLGLQGITTLCTDLHEERRQTRRLHERYAVATLVSYRKEDATALTAASNTFDLVIFKSVLGALGSRERARLALTEMLRVLKPGGMLLFAENLSGSRLHQFLRKHFVAWAAGSDPWRYMEMPGDNDLFEGYERVEMRSLGFLGCLGQTEAQRNLLACLDSVILPAIPPRWRYILYGAAFKPGPMKSSVDDPESRVGQPGTEVAAQA